MELTKFEVIVPTDQPFESLPDETWDQPAPAAPAASDAATDNGDDNDKNWRLECHELIY